MEELKKEYPFIHNNLFQNKNSFFFRNRDIVSIYESIIIKENLKNSDIDSKNKKRL